MAERYYKLNTAKTTTTTTTTMTPLVRKVYAAAILVTVLGQERGLVPSEDFPKPPFP